MRAERRASAAVRVIDEKISAERETLLGLKAQQDECLSKIKMLTDVRESIVAASKQAGVK